MRRISTLALAIAVIALIAGASSLTYARGMGSNSGPMAGRGEMPPGQGGTERDSMQQHMTSNDPMAATAAKANATLAAKNPGQLLSQNTRLAAKVAELLPPNSDLQKESQGFKTLGEFVSAAHASHDLNIPWDQLRAKITAGDNLGNAIKELSPQADLKTEVRKARREAMKDVEDSLSTT